MSKQASEPEKRTLIADPEIVALSKIGRLMEALDAEARHRVCDYMVAKYAPYAERATPEN